MGLVRPGGSLEDPPAGRYLAVAAGHYHSVGIVDTSEPCAEDLNDDQSVDFADLIVVLNGWGPAEHLVMKISTKMVPLAFKISRRSSRLGALCTD